MEKIREDEKKKRINKLRELVKKGYTNKEISQEMNYSIEYIVQLKRYCKKNGLWFSEDEIKKFKEQRKLRSAKGQKRKSIEQQRKLREYTRYYNLLKVDAKQEDRQEINGEEDIPTSGRKKFIEVLMQLHNLGKTMKEEDIKIITNLLYCHPEVTDKNTLKLLVLDANRKGGKIAGMKMINELIEIAEDTKFYTFLIEFKRWYRNNTNIPEIKRLKSEGLNNTEIGLKLGYTSAEIAVLLDSTDETLVFFDNER